MMRLHHPEVLSVDDMPGIDGTSGVLRVIVGSACPGVEGLLKTRALSNASPVVIMQLDAQPARL